MKYLYEGLRSIAYTEDDNIVLVSKNKQATITYKQDFETYKLLEGKIKTVKIPSNVQFIKPSEKYKFGALKYKMIQGKVFKDEEMETYNLKGIANSLGDFLNELHFLTKDYDELLVKKEKELILENIELLKNYLTEREINTIFKFKDKYFEYISTPQELVFTHGDLWYENYILDESGSKLVGIIDFENAKYFFKADDPIFANIFEKMESLAYGCNSTIINEHIIRALTIRWRSNVIRNEQATNKAISREKDLGFIYIENILNSLIIYENNRDKYPNIDVFYPIIIENIVSEYEQKMNINSSNALTCINWNAIL